MRHCLFGMVDHFKRMILVAAVCVVPLSAQQPQLEPAVLHNPELLQYNNNELKIDVNPASITYNQYYAKHNYEIVFASYVIDLPPAARHADSETTWQAIDMQATALRAAFQAVEMQFGSFILRKKFPDIVDPTRRAAKTYLVVFTKDAPVDAVVHALANIEGVDRCRFLNGAAQMLGVPSDPAVQPGTSVADVSLNGQNALDFFPRDDYHKRSWQWGIYDVFCPLAWEITEGDPDIVIGIDDSWTNTTATLSFTHPDLHVRDATHPNGNYLHITNPGAGTQTSLDLTIDHHAFTVCATAIAKSNNEGIVGSCPDCSGLGTGMAGSPYHELDVDAVTAGIQTPHVMNCSYISITSGLLYRNAIEAGVVVVASAGNGPYNGLVVSHLSTPARGNPIDHVPAAYIFSTSASHPPDAKVLAVGALLDGKALELACIAQGEHVNKKLFWDARRSLFPPSFNFSPTADKSIIQSADLGTTKQPAFLDIVAPAPTVLAVADEAGYEFSFNGLNTSRSTAFVSGIVGLMRSVEENLGVQGRDIHRKIYDIITFTADKIVDPGHPEDIDELSVTAIRPSTGLENLVILPTHPDHPVTRGSIQYEYEIQGGDPLRRSWAQRMGYGRINAFRAVAHAVPSKGIATYTSAGQFDIQNAGFVNGKRVMHWGALNVTGNSVLAHGGNAIPGNPDYDNSHGTTKINGVTLTVPSGTLLAVDGRLMSDNGAAANRVTTFGTGKIVITGYIEDVEVIGDVMAGNVIVNSTTAINNGRIRLDGKTCEIYGTAELRNFGEIVVDDGDLRLKPGGRIALRGSRDLIVQNGATLTLEYGSGIYGDPGRKIVVQDGATLVIESGAEHVGIFCDVEIENGGALIVQNDAQLVLATDDARFYTDEDAAASHSGSIKLQPGGALDLNDGSRIVSHDAQSGVVIVENGAVLTVPAGIRTGLECTVSIAKGGLMTVSSTAELTLGRFFVEGGDNMLKFGAIGGGRLIFEQGSATTLLARESISSGILRIEGSPGDRAALSGVYNDPDCRADNFARVTCVGNDPLSDSRVHIQYADITHARFVVRDIATDDFVGVDFSTDRALVRDQLEAGSGTPRPLAAFLEAHVPISEPGIGFYLPADARDITLTNCSFSDAGGRVKTDANGLINGKDYDISGAEIIGLRDVVVNSCVFTNMNQGVHTAHCMDVEFQGNIVNECNYSLDDIGSAVSYCQNMLTEVEFGNAHMQSLESTIFDNDYTVVGAGFFNQGGAIQYIYGNRFTEHHRGVATQSGSVALNDRDIGGPVGASHRFNGRNAFERGAQQTPFVLANGHGSDVGFYPDDAVYLMCGLNLFTDVNADPPDASHVHLENIAGTEGANPGVRTINGGNNRYRHQTLTHAVKYDPNFIAFSGAQLDLSEAPIPTCTIILGTPTLCVAGVPWEEREDADHMICSGDPYPNNGLWIDLTPTDPLLDIYFDNARIMMLDAARSTHCRRAKAFDAFQAAILDDDAFAKLQTLTTAYAGIALTGAADPQLRVIALLLQGQAHERLAEWSQAAIAYTQAQTSFPGERLAQLAGLRLVYVNAVLSDPAFGDTYRSLVADYHSQTLWQRRTISGAGLKQSETSAATTGYPGHTILRQNSPNPFSDETLIEFYVPETQHVKLSVSDAFGRTMVVLAEGQYSQGWHQTQLSAKNLAAGVYHYALYTGETVVAQQMLVVR